MRTDVHSPKRLVTEDYEYVNYGYNYIEGVPGWVATMGDFGLELSRWIGRTDHLGRGTNQCHHCGARLNYFAIMRHIPTGDAVIVGETCLDNRFELATADFQRMRKQATLGRKAAALRKALEQYAADNPDIAFLAVGDDVPDVLQGNAFIASVVRAVRRYGSPTPGQERAVRKAYQDALERAEKPEKPKVSAPTGRITVTGTVISTKLLESDWGVTLKMLLEVPEGEGTWRLWVTVPSAMVEPTRGDTVSVKATVRHSDNDDTFAIGSRPVVPPK